MKTDVNKYGGNRREDEMYGAIKAYLKNSRACKYVYADLPEDKKKVHLPRNLSRRDPDVVGVTDEGEVHIAEGKCLKGSGALFEQCVHQASSLKAWADFLYVFFPLRDWGL